jgi:hypothetical protein
MSQQHIPLETLTTSVTGMTARRKKFKKMIKKFSKLTTSVNPFLLRILKTGAGRTLLLATGTFATLLFAGCANGGAGERANSRASFISTSEQRQDTFGIGGVPQNSAFVDWTKPPRSQTGPTYPQYGSIGTP